MSAGQKIELFCKLLNPLSKTASLRMNTANGDAQFVLETERLRIVRLSVDHAAFILELLNTPSWISFIGDRGVKTIIDARQYIVDGPISSYNQFGFGSYLVMLKSNGAFIGMCGLLKRDTLEDIDIGFAFLPDYTGKGYGYEAATAVMVHAREAFGAIRIAGITHPDNQPSIRLLKKLGLCFEQTIRLHTDGAESLLFRTPITQS